jgi:anaerobic selenocysteine-containing dehydrogenase
MSVARTICPYCGVGCGLVVEVDGGRVSRVRGDDRHPGTLGRLCRKAVYLPAAVNSDTRLTHPMVRARRGGPLERAGWDDAMGLAAERVRSIVDSDGPDAFGFYLSGQLLTEEYYVANKLAKGFLGTNNVDSNSRLCMAGAVSAYRLTLGQDGPPCAYQDLDHADLFFFIGSNAADCHPVLFKRALQRKKADPEGVTIVVADPRRTRTAQEADLFLQLRPGTDLALLYGMLHVVIREGLLDELFIRDHTVGWEALAKAASRWDPTIAGAICDVAPELIVAAGRAFGWARAALSLWSMGLNQTTTGVDKGALLIGLHLATGQIGRRGAGPFSLTGQPNAMGGREVGGLAGLLPGYRSVESAEDRAAIATVWGVPADRISPCPGRTAVEMFDALRGGEMKAIWIAATNPAASVPNGRAVREGLERAELVVVQDAYAPTETTDLADIVLPAAQWSEKEGTATSSERRIAYLPAAVPPPGEARPDWRIFAELGARLGYGAAFDYRRAEDVFAEYRACTIGTAVDLGGISYARLQRVGPIQWPCPAGAAIGTTRLYVDKRFATPDGRARFVAPAGGPEIGTSAPLTLITGREPDQWHTMTRTGHVPQLLRSCPEPYVALHPEDAESLGITNGGQVELAIPGQGTAAFPARVTTDVRPGSLFAPFHWGAQRHPGGGVNDLTPDALDPISKQPGLKHAPVQVRRAPSMSSPELRQIGTEGLPSPPTALPAAGEGSHAERSPVHGHSRGGEEQASSRESVHA